MKKITPNQPGFNAASAAWLAAFVTLIGIYGCMAGERHAPTLPQNEAVRLQRKAKALHAAGIALAPNEEAVLDEMQEAHDAVLQQWATSGSPSDYLKAKVRLEDAVKAARRVLDHYQDPEAGP